MAHSMATKTLTTQQLSASTYGRFGRGGVTVDVRGFLKTPDGQQLLRDMQKAAESQTASRAGKKR